MPLRYLQGAQQYRIGDVIEVQASRNPSDNRPESFRVNPDSIEIVDRVKPDQNEWAARRAWVFRDLSWHYGGLADLDVARRADGTSVGLIRPGVVERVYLRAKPAAARGEFEAKWLAVTSQVDLFLPEYKNLEYLPMELRIVWRCSTPCETCAVKPHDMQVLDWGLLELARRQGEWEKARRKLEEISDLTRHDFRMFIGNFFLHQHVWGVIGLWYPKLQLQRSLL
ncbi:MAG: hypothetical protein K2X99_09130 [Gemmatimonadaceae bacterium]|nr:hypothetical protein [Gemmatimonadaceae bacterium]